MKALVIDDDATFRGILVAGLRDEVVPGFEVEAAGDLETGMARVAAEAFQLVVVDMGLPERRGGPVEPEGGRRVLEAIEKAGRTPRVVVVSGIEREAAVRLLLAHRIHDFMFKDTAWDEIVARLSAQATLAERLDLADRSLATLAESRSGEPVGEDPALRAELARAKKAAATDATVLVTGESGTGKELVARLVHEASPRRGGPFVVVNCAALSESLFESELFGHKRGAFTGAVEDRIGRFELAGGGTLFLDEIGEVPLAVQPKLLRVLQEGTFERVGESRTRRSEVRLVAATNRDLEAESRSGRFRLDLYYRLAVFQVHLPPLRERPGDIPRLARHFLAGLARKLGRPVRRIAPEAEAALAAAPWPGNIRQLRNVIEAGLILEEGDELRLASLPPLAPRGGAHRAAPGRSGPASSPASEPVETGTDGDPRPAGPGLAAPPDAWYRLPWEEATRSFEAEYLRRHLLATRGSAAAVAARTGLQVRTLRNRLERCGLELDAFR